MTLALAAAAVPLLLALFVLALVQPVFALLALVVLDISNLNEVLAGHVGVSPYRPLLALAVVALFVLFRRQRFQLPWSPVTLGLLILFAGFCISSLSAADPLTLQSLLFSRGRDFLYYLVILALVTSLNRVYTIAAAVVLVLAGLAGLTAVHEFVLGNQGDLFGLSRVPLVQEGGALTARHAGTSSDVNFWARLLILIAPLSFSLWAAATSRRDRLLWATCSASLALGTYLTQSRGGFIAFIIAVVAWLVLAGGRYRRSVLLLPVLLAIAIPLTGVGSRLQSLTAITSASTANADPSVVERKRLQMAAWRMFLDQPLTGHGIGSYEKLFHRYDRLSDSYRPVDIVVAAHNFYLEQAADGGIFILLAWAIFIASILYAATYSLVIANRGGDDMTRFLAVGVIASISGWLVASVFLHLSDLRSPLLLVALAAALQTRAARLPAARTAPSLPSSWIIRPRHVLLVGVLVLTSVAVLICGLLRPHKAYVTESTLAVVPTQSGTRTAAYQLDVINRNLIAPTLAAVVDASLAREDLGLSPTDSEVTLQVAQSPLGGAVVLTTTSSSRATSDSASTAAVLFAKDRVSGLQDDYVLAGEAGPAISTRSWPPWIFSSVLAIWLACAVVLRRGVQRVGPRDLEDLAQAR